VRAAAAAAAADTLGNTLNFETGDKKMAAKKIPEPNRVARFFMTQCTKTEGKYTKWPLNYPMDIIYSIVLYNIPIFFIPRHSEIHSNGDFGFEN
jgi:hypothetical protein